jgi:hypothetical protein
MISWLIWLIIVAAVLAIAYVAVRAMGVPVPQWCWQIAGIIIVAVVAILAIRFLLTVAL